MGEFNFALCRHNNKARTSQIEVFSNAMYLVTRLIVFLWVRTQHLPTPLVPLVNISLAGFILCLGGSRRER